MRHKDRRDRELPYISDASVLAEQFKTKLLLRSFNRSLPFNAPKEYVLFKLLGVKHGKSIYIEPPFRCDYGKHIEIGDNSVKCNTNVIQSDSFAKRDAV